uniref:DNA mismatch repair proteins mutS family domain-containing protein n=1 Tax=Clastoptera arizonana TaxID=38151 RepID=A0A1B6D8P9_9HEMI
MTSNAVFATPVNTPLRKGSSNTHSYLGESLLTPKQKMSSETNSNRTSNRVGLKRVSHCLAPPSIINKKTRSSSGSGIHPWITPSSSRTPRTPRSGLNFEKSDHYVIVAITEGRGIARGEVGLAALDMKHPYLVLCQISDSQTYSNTMIKINVLDTCELLVPNTFVEGQAMTKLMELINSGFPSITITTVQRQHFSDKTGLSQVRNLCLNQYSSVELVVSRKFYALSAAAALIKYVEFEKNVFFAPKSLKIVYQSATDIMNIDVETAQRLELVLSYGSNEINGSLFGILNHCSTISGYRLLRANILQPPTTLPQIEKRLNSVTELAQNPMLLHSLQSTLIKFKEVEQLLWMCVQTSNSKNDLMATESQMNFILLLKTTMENISVLKDCLQDTQTSFFHEVLKDLADEKFETILNSINEVINEDARVTKGHLASQLQRCFAVKSGINGLLDVTRAAYSDLANNVYETVKAMAEEYGLPLRVNKTGNKGFHVVLNLGPNKQFSSVDLPPIFIQVNRSKNSVSFTTEEINFLNLRLKVLLQEIQTISNVILFKLIQNLRQHISCLYKLCENIAELDLIMSFAQISSSENFVRPSFGEVLKLTDSRHPILDFICPNSPVGNDVFASKDENFCLITGPNMGGKSVYIRQVALLQIMAQVGCYVPATSAEFRITNWLFSRIGFDDSIVHNTSSFMLEMKEMQYISQNIGKNSLVIIDELGRSTSAEEGTAIAWAFCEHLLQSRAFTFFTTHFLFLTKLQDLYKNVKNYYMKADEKFEGEHCRLLYTYKIQPGVNKITNYGLKLAKLSSMPPSIIKVAEEFVEKLNLQPKFQAVIECTENYDLTEELMNKCKDLKKNGHLSLRNIHAIIIGSDVTNMEQNSSSGCNEVLNDEINESIDLSDEEAISTCTGPESCISSIQQDDCNQNMINFNENIINSDVTNDNEEVQNEDEISHSYQHSKSQEIDISQEISVAPQTQNGTQGSLSEQRKTPKQKNDNETQNQSLSQQQIQRVSPEQGISQKTPNQNFFNYQQKETLNLLTNGKIQITNQDSSILRQHQRVTPQLSSSKQTQEDDQDLFSNKQRTTKDEILKYQTKLQNIDSSVHQQVQHNGVSVHKQIQIVSPSLSISKQIPTGRGDLCDNYQNKTPNKAFFHQIQIQDTTFHQHLQSLSPNFSTFQQTQNNNRDFSNHHQNKTAINITDYHMQNKDSYLHQKIQNSTPNLSISQPNKTDNQDYFNIYQEKTQNKSIYHEESLHQQAVSPIFQQTHRRSQEFYNQQRETSNQQNLREIQHQNLIVGPTFQRRTYNSFNEQPKQINSQESHTHPLIQRVSPTLSTSTFQQVQRLYQSPVPFNRQQINMGTDDIYINQNIQTQPYASQQIPDMADYQDKCGKSQNPYDYHQFQSRSPDMFIDQSKNPNPFQNLQRDDHQSIYNENTNSSLFSIQQMERRLLNQFINQEIQGANTLNFANSDSQEIGPLVINSAENCPNMEVPLSPDVSRIPLYAYKNNMTDN